MGSQRDFLKTLSASVYLGFLLVGASMPWHIEVREQLARIKSSLQPCGLWGFSSGHQACWYVPLLTEL